MTKEDLDKFWLTLMVVFLAGTSPTWLNPQSQAQSAYDAPWIYPGLAPKTQ